MTSVVGAGGVVGAVVTVVEVVVVVAVIEDVYWRHHQLEEIRHPQVKREGIEGQRG